MRLSVIIPTRALDARVLQHLTRVRAALPTAEILVVEPEQPREPPHAGGHPDRAPSRQLSPETMARSPGAIAALDLRRLTAERGRGTQCRAGAESAAGNLLLFLHDDTRLPEDAEAVIRRAFEDPSIGAACFRLAFDRRHWLLGIYGWLSRFETLFTTFGDQAMVVRRELYDAVGGFPDWPLFEDVELARRLRRRTRIRKLPQRVVTSAERFEKRGMLRQQFGNGWLMLRFLLGASPTRLAAHYEAQRAGQTRQTEGAIP
ncbi:glycosyl transferase family 2 [Thiohalocapsa marina]|uniref:Glycosyl transferase family 2 n=1 Tax=Thiohalocapsa marina TaxID=424902 RepID=A0A5M8FN21_9GAMM|nr:glycosyltransferase family 2 protein [Thiohalocapsa marina]KAA6186288.1 glycosyl transferase family 2 [Thiohalocapsa marina]